MKTDLTPEHRYSPRFRKPTSDPRVLSAGVGEAAECLATRLKREQRLANRVRLVAVFADGRAVAAEAAFERGTSEEPQLYRAGRGLLARVLAQPHPVQKLTLILDRLGKASPTLPLFDRAELAITPRDPTLALRVSALRAKFAARTGAA
jgi:hypothetical protein